jgi:anaerobic C4-dicarboxylate transporter
LIVLSRILGACSTFILTLEITTGLSIRTQIPIQFHVTEEKKIKKPVRPSQLEVLGRSGTVDRSKRETSQSHLYNL